MALNSRQKDITKYLKDKGRASVKELAGKFFVSEMTVRRDLKELESGGFIQRYSGGAAYLGEYENMPLDSRRLMRTAEKKMIAEKTRKHLHDNMTVFIDSSSTTLYIIPILGEFKNITIVTNSIQCLIAAAKYNINCIIAGGVYYAYDMCTVGGKTNDFLRDINADVGFFSVCGLSSDGILSDPDERQTSVRRTVMENCKVKVFLFDSEKVNKKYTYTLCRADEVQDIIIV